MLPYIIIILSMSTRYLILNQINCANFVLKGKSNPLIECCIIHIQINRLAQMHNWSLDKFKNFEDALKLEILFYLQEDEAGIFKKFFLICIHVTFYRRRRLIAFYYNWSSVLLLRRPASPRRQKCTAILKTIQSAALILVAPNSS